VIMPRFGFSVVQYRYLWIPDRASLVRDDDQ
jgi:hypothetical protein